MRSLTPKQKQTLSTAWTIIVGIGVLLGIFTDAPNGIANLIANGPAILSHPNTWWVVGVLLMGGVVLRLIWRQPEPDDIRSRYLRTLQGQVPNTASLRVVRLSEFLDDAKKACYPSVFAWTFLKHDWIEQKLRHVYPGKIHDLIGQQAAETYHGAMERAFEAGGYHILIYQACYSVIESLVLNEIAKELDGLGHSVPPHHLPALPKPISADGGNVVA